MYPLVGILLQELIKNIMYFLARIQKVFHASSSLKTFGEHQENLMYFE